MVLDRVKNLKIIFIKLDVGKINKRIFGGSRCNHQFFLEKNKKETTLIFKELLINEQITESEVRLIGENGEMLGVLPIAKARSIADEKELDLVLMNGGSKPAVCKLMDYGKYKFDAIKKDKEIKRNQKIIEVKEIQLSMTISDHDIAYRVTNAKKFLSEGNKVKVSLRMRGRQQAYTKTCIEVVKNFCSLIADAGTTDKEPEVNGKNIIVVVNPKKA